MPTEVGQRHRCIFELARRFRSFLEYRDKPPEDLLDIFAEWYDKAVAVIGTKDWLKNWEDFVDAWKLVKYPTGTGSLQVFMDRAAETALPNYAAPFRIADTPVSMLLRVCRELQRDAGNRPFFLSARSAASICGVETMSGWRYLKCLVGFGVLAPVSTGEYATRKASEWRYIRPLDE